MIRNPISTLRLTAQTISLLTMLFIIQHSWAEQNPRNGARFSLHFVNKTNVELKTHVTEQTCWPGHESLNKRTIKASNILSFTTESSVPTSQCVIGTTMGVLDSAVRFTLRYTSPSSKRAVDISHIRLAYRRSTHTASDVVGGTGGTDGIQGSAWAHEYSHENPEIIMSEFNCQQLGRTISCVAQINDALLDQHKDKNESGLARARRYGNTGAPDSGIDGIVFDDEYRSLFEVASNGNGGVKYTQEFMNRNFPLRQPATSDCNSSSIIFVVLFDRRMYAVPLCGRNIVQMPMRYRTTFKSNSQKQGDTDKQSAVDWFDMGSSHARISSSYTLTHGGLAGAQKVRMAGKMKLDNDGNIVDINTDSGHYRPPSYALLNLARYYSNHDYKGIFEKPKDRRFVAKATGNYSSLATQ